MTFRKEENPVVSIGLSPIFMDRNEVPFFCVVPAYSCAFNIINMLECVEYLLCAHNHGRKQGETKLI